MVVERRFSRVSRRKQRRRKKTGARLTFVLVGILVLMTLGYTECIRSTPGESRNVTKGKVLGRIVTGKYDDDITKGYSKRWYVRVWVQVEFMHGEIRKIKVLSHRHFWPKAKKATKLIPQLIVEKQNTKVKAVSGATLSSKAIMLAVQDALDNNHEKRMKVYEQTGDGGYMKDKY